jgi:hypothetical protein
VIHDNAAIAEIASMLPANADEAVLAATCVAANACAMPALAEAPPSPRLATGYGSGTAPPSRSA